MPSAPFVKGSPFLGVLPEFRKSAPQFLLRVAGQHGDLTHFKLAAQHTFLVNHPVWIKDILVTHQSNFKKSRVLERAKVFLGDGLLTSEGEFHTRQRRLSQPAFHRDRLIGYGTAMVECTVRCRDQWKAGSSFDVSKEMNRLTLAIVARTLFSADVSSDADEIGASLTELLGMFERVQIPFSEWLDKLPLPSTRRAERARAVLDRIIYGVIAERRANPRDTGDLLSMLLLAQDEGSGMSDKQVRDEALTLFLAGH
jgi:cytochrome P450